MSDSSLKRSGMAHVNRGSHSFTCHPHVLCINGMSQICLYFPATQYHRDLASTHFLSHWEEEAELAWVPDYTPRRYTRVMVTYLSTNLARYRVTLLIMLYAVTTMPHGCHYAAPCWYSSKLWWDSNNVSVTNLLLSLTVRLTCKLSAFCEVAGQQ